MKKISLLIGALGGALGGYLLSNTKLREGLINAKDPEEAAKILGKALQHDGKKLAKDAQSFIESKEVQDNLKKARKYAEQRMNDAKKQVEVFMKKGQKKAISAAKRGAVAAKKSVKRGKNGFTSEAM
ncbi:MAG TPA: hypothetical protein VI873_03355 [Candidatus Peribacteraceae bacterium]|nr:hypothetical protein [Candidatus Peribacteraceae bacterium]